MTHPTPICLVRPPWPDELERLSAAFPGLPWMQAMHLRVLVTPGPMERLVGVAALVSPPAGQESGTLLLRLRERFLDCPEADALVRKLLSLARGLRLSLLVVPVQEPNDARTDLLLRGGFTLDPAGKLWRQDLG